MSFKKYMKDYIENLKEHIFESIQFNNYIQFNKFINMYKGDINFKDSFNGLTPFMYAVYYDRKPMLELLFEKGVNVNLKNDDGETALIMAAILNRYYMVVDLINLYNADIFITDSDNLFFTDHLDETYLEIFKEDYPTQYNEILVRKNAQKYNL